MEKFKIGDFTITLIGTIIQHLMLILFLIEANGKSYFIQEISGHGRTQKEVYKNFIENPQKISIA